MSETPKKPSTPSDPEEFPFTPAELAEWPYKRGSTEEKAIERVIEKYERAQRAAEERRSGSAD